MKFLLNGLSSLSTKFPIVVLVFVVVLSGFFGSLGAPVQESGFENFSPDSKEIDASDKIREYFGSEGSTSIFQVIFEGEDIITPEAYALWSEIEDAVATSDLAPYILSQPGQPLMQGYMASVAAASQFNPALDPATLDIADFKDTFNQSISYMPPEVRGFVTASIGSSYNDADTTAKAGLGILRVNSAAIAADAEGVGQGAVFAYQGALESQLAESITKISNEFNPDSVRATGFTFSLVFSGDQEDFANEVGTLFMNAGIIIFFVLAVIFFIRSLRGLRRTFADLFLALGTVGLAIFWMNSSSILLGPEYLGLIGNLNEISQITPIILIGLGVDYSIHFTSRYRKEISEGNKVTDSLGTTIGTVGIGLTLATLATIVGFLTNLSSPLPPLADFGILTSVGIFYAFLLVLTFVPAMRTLLDRRGERKETLPLEMLSVSGNSFLSKFSASTSIIPAKAKFVSVLLLIGISGGGYFAFTNIDTVFRTTDFIPRDNPLVETLEVLTDEFGGGFGETTTVLIEGENLATPEVHNGLIDATIAMGSLDNIIMFGDNPAADSIVGSMGQRVFDQATGMPNFQEIQILGSYGLVMSQSQSLSAFKAKESGDVEGLYAYLIEQDPEALGSLVYQPNGGAITAMQVQIQTNAGAEGAAELRDGLYEAFSSLSNSGVSVVVTSDNIITQSISDLISSSQFRSLILAIVASMVFLVLYYLIDIRRPFLGVITVLPVAAIVLGTYLGMYYLGIPLNPVTSTLSALAIGIGVPFVIHVTNRFTEGLSNSSDAVSVAKDTLKTTGAALFGSAFTTMAGFGILTTSTLLPFQQMGQVVVVSLGFALVASILILPTLLVFWGNYHIKKEAKNI